jgi:phosphatidylinositol glycan class A protein
LIAIFGPRWQSSRSGKRDAALIRVRLVYRKGADLIIEVVRKMCAADHNISFIVAGAGPKSADLEDMVERNNVRKDCLSRCSCAQNGLFEIGLRVYTMSVLITSVCLDCLR